MSPHPSGWRLSKERLAELDAAGAIIWRNQKTPLRKSYLKDYKGKPVGSLWTDIPNAGGNERLGYDTQKPLALLRRIICAGSKEGDVVFDPFCGCATTLEAAQRLNRKWIGVDIAIHAIKRVAKVRLEERLQLLYGKDFSIEGVPRNLEGATDLWELDKYQFQKWCVEQVGGFVTTKKTADGGIDGRLYFQIPGASDLQSMILEVKGGKTVSIRDLRALGHVLDTSNSLLAGLIVLHPLSKRKLRNFQLEMAKAGHLEIDGLSYPRMQIRTVQQILDGNLFDSPTTRGKSTTGFLYNMEKFAELNA